MVNNKYYESNNKINKITKNHFKLTAALAHQSR